MAKEIDEVFDELIIGKFLSMAELSELRDKLKREYILVPRDPSKQLVHDILKNLEIRNINKNIKSVKELYRFITTCKE